ncbi:MAG: glycosyltransferase, partial [Sedimentisphaerales bacterium]|nr:glycosyltransferase [Sedimentisphaerales bacterium]
MNILMLNYEFPPIGGGAGNAHLCLLRQYADNSDLRIDVLTSAPKPGFFTETLSKNITIYKVGLHKKNLHFWRKAEVIEWLLKARPCYRKLLRENNYDLVHAFFGFPTGWLCYHSRDKLPYIISLRGSDVPGYNIRLGLDYKLMTGLFRRIWSCAAAVVANSEGLRRLALEFMPTLDIGVIPNGIDTEKYYPSQKQEQTKPIKV